MGVWMIGGGWALNAFMIGVGGGADNPCVCDYGGTWLASLASKAVYCDWCIMFLTVEELVVIYRHSVTM